MSRGEKHWEIGLGNFALDAMILLATICAWPRPDARCFSDFPPCIVHFEQFMLRQELQLIVRAGTRLAHGPNVTARRSYALSRTRVQRVGLRRVDHGGVVNYSATKLADASFAGAGRRSKNLCATRYQMHAITTLHAPSRPWPSGLGHQALAMTSIWLRPPRPAAERDHMRA